MHAEQRLGQQLAVSVREAPPWAAVAPWAPRRFCLTSRRPGPRSTHRTGWSAIPIRMLSNTLRHEPQQEDVCACQNSNRAAGFESACYGNDRLSCCCAVLSHVVVHTAFHGQWVAVVQPQPHGQEPAAGEDAGAEPHDAVALAGVLRRQWERPCDSSRRCLPGSCPRLNEHSRNMVQHSAGCTLLLAQSLPSLSRMHMLHLDVDDRKVGRGEVKVKKCASAEKGEPILLAGLRANVAQPQSAERRHRRGAELGNGGGPSPQQPPSAPAPRIPDLVVQRPQRAGHQRAVALRQHPLLQPQRAGLKPAAGRVFGRSTIARQSRLPCRRQGERARCPAKAPQLTA